MNIDTGQMGTLADVLRDARPGERIIPATLIPDSYEARLGKERVSTVRPPLYGPRKPLREVRAELQAAKAEA